ncbi:hypothetical protein CMI38_03100 [Candidatus Pacearchaeota archaeon]|jgi:predicted transcriptional regulator|nr:hypothetical protein [Candidatus Pacearchaeota archaeon]|tara:strand:+ start:5081 stop:5686 length:606 start_codon:yes stop_codon:yes gene_type:complete
MFGFFGKKVEKDEFNEFRYAVQTGFGKAKQDIESVSKWIKHLDSVDSGLKEEVMELNGELATVKSELVDIKNMLSIVGNKQVFKQSGTVFSKQTAVDSVLNTVETGVQTSFLENLTTNERAIIFVLLNSDMKLSYEDLASMMGKRKSTIRGQVNSIKQKSEGLIQEVVSENNKKRVYIPERAKEILLKTRKVREKGRKRQE